MGIASIWHWLIVLILLGGLGAVVFVVVRARKSMAQAVQPVGFGGWLLLLAIGQTLAPLRILADLGAMTESYDVVRTLPNGVAAATGEIALNCFYFLFVVAVVVLMYRKSWRFPIMFTYQWYLYFVVQALDFLWIAYMLKVPVRTLASNYTSEEIGRIVAAFVAGGLWVWYVNASSRVRNTFVRT